MLILRGQQGGGGRKRKDIYNRFFTCFQDSSVFSFIASHWGWLRHCRRKTKWESRASPITHTLRTVLEQSRRGLASPQYKDSSGCVWMGAEMLKKPSP